jgi:hypothetical protein
MTNRNQAKEEMIKRLLPKLKVIDVDWKWLFLLGFLMFWTIGDDVLLPVIGELLDVVELPIDVIVAMILSRNTFQRAAKREAEEATTVQGRVVSDTTLPDVVKPG